MAKKPKREAADDAAPGGEFTHFSVSRTVHLDVRGVSVTIEADRKHGHDAFLVRELRKIGVEVDEE